MNDVMLDIETFGTDSNAVIVSISAVRFNIETGELGDEFEIGLDVQQQVDEKAVIDGSTIMWWLSQSDSARHELVKLKSRSIKIVVKKLNAFLSEEKVKGLWGNGATFDNVLVRNLFKRHGHELVVPFWADRCVRTFVDIMDINKGDFTFDGVPHNGLDDCKHQIKYMTQKASK